jgi:DNA-binding transcriptional ArsR family regulator
MRRPSRPAKPSRKRSAATSDELAPVFDAVAEYFGLLAEPTRLAILHTICNDERTVSAIVEATGATQTNVSRHLGLLHAAGVVSRRRDGSSVHYRVADPVFVEICRSACVRIAARIDAQSPLAGDLLDYARQS